jgi:hypothetical protein
MPLSIRTIAHRPDFTVESLSEEHTGPIVACDFYVVGAELGREVPGGYEIDSLLNVDHHAPTQRMMQYVSSTNLAIDHVKAVGPTHADSLVIVSHTDCDSVLSSCIMAGELEPDERFGEAAIAADHTGETNEIADALQSFDSLRHLYFSLRNLRKLLDGKPLDSTAQPYYNGRLKKREDAAAAVANRNVSLNGPLAFGVLEKRLDGEFFPARIPDAALILLMNKRADSRGWDAKMRLGLRAPSGASLNDLRTERFDSAFAGRWNAGSNARNGGTILAPDVYARHVTEAMRQSWGV